MLVAGSVFRQKLDMRQGLRWLHKPTSAPIAVGFDVETYLTQPGLQIPKLVCASFAFPEGYGFYGDENVVLTAQEAYELFVALLADPQYTIVAHNAAFDASVMALYALEQGDEQVFEQIVLAYEQGRIRCTLVRQKLIDIAHGSHKYHWDHRYLNKKTNQLGGKQKTTFSLEACVWRHFGERMDKENSPRLHFDTLDGLPIEEYPPDAIEYSLQDSIQGLKVFHKQSEEVQWDDEEQAGDRLVIIPNEIPQTCSAFALYLLKAHGVRTNKERTLKLFEELNASVSKSYAILKHWGLVRGKGAKGKEGSQNMEVIYRFVVQAFEEAGLKVPRTRTGKPSTDKEGLEAVVLADDLLKALMDDYEAGSIDLDDERWTAAAKVSVWRSISVDKHTLANFLPRLLKGVDAPINPGWNVLVETGRTSCANPNMQNPPRKGGVRECIEARWGHVFIGADYDTLELRTLAQVCYILFGVSEMREAILRGEDLHSSFAAGLMGLTYEEFARRLADGDSECEDQRQFAKIVNFGAPGGLGAAGLVGYAKGYGVTIDERRARKLLQAWHKRWPEMKRFFAYVKGICAGGEGQLTQIPAGRVRGGCKFTAACNSFFQGLAADGAKDAIWRVFKECYLDKTSPLYGCRLTLFLHDELILECPFDNSDIGRRRASNAAKRLQQVMIDAMQDWVEDLPIKASPVMYKRWYKGAKPVYINEVMVPSFPKVEKDATTGKKKTKWVPDEEFLAVA